MKKSSNYLLLVVLIITTSFIYKKIDKDSQNQTYYWYFDKKIFVKYDYSIWSLKLKDSTSNLEKKFTREVLKSQKLSHGFTRVDLKRDVLYKELSSSVEFDIAIPSILIGDQKESPLLMNGTVIIMPKEGTDFELLKKKFNLSFLRKMGIGSSVFKVNDYFKTLEIANQIHESGIVKWCNPDFYAQIKGAGPDPLYVNQYYLNQTNNIDINAPEAWAITKGSSHIRVAVLDNGLEHGVNTHEDLAGRVVSGYTPDSLSYNTHGAPVLAGDQHGIACAGIIGASHDNSLGIKGIAPNSIIVPVIVYGLGASLTSHVSDAITWSYLPTGGNADILNNSWENWIYGYYDAGIAQAFSDARTYGRDGKGCIIVGVSGNFSSWGGVTFPGNLPDVITVGAISPSGTIWSYSNTGSEVDLVCPSGDLITVGATTTAAMGYSGTTTTNYMNLEFGRTSAAAPQVSGVAALMLSMNPGMTETQVRTILQQSATDMGSTGFDNTFGYGRLNAQNALQRTLIHSTLSGPTTFCDSAKFKITNLQNFSEATWTSSPTGVVTFTNSGDTAVNVSRVGSFNGKVTISAKIGLGTVTMAQDVYVGRPSGFGIDGPTEIMISQPESFYAINTLAPLSGITDYQWGLVGGTATLSEPSNGELSLMIHTTGNYTITLSLLNSCGLSDVVTFPIRVVRNNLFKVFPNPANESISISSEDVDKEKQISQFKGLILNEQGQQLQQKFSKNGQINFDTQSLPDGLYYIHVIRGNTISKKQIVIKH